MMSCMNREENTLQENLKAKVSIFLIYILGKKCMFAIFMITMYTPKKKKIQMLVCIFE